MKQPHYLAIDIGTGNVRVALIEPSGNILKVATDAVRYQRDSRYQESIYFDPEELWGQIVQLCRKVLTNVSPNEVVAVTTSSQREGIVLLNKEGKDVIGMPNIDHRGREFEDILKDKRRVYQLTGRYPTSLFSAFKVVGFREKYPELSAQIAHMVSISDWAVYRLSGQMGYEHSQASETLLYDVASQRWSEELCAYFGIHPEILPPLVRADEIAGTLLKSTAESIGLHESVLVVTGGADTQLAVQSTMPSTNDIILVSGTTTPVVKIVDRYITDDAQRTWTNSHTETGLFILETNAGVTGLNLQRYKAIFYPNESYDTMAAEIREAIIAGPQCWAALGSLLAGEEKPLLRGGFVLPVPLSHDLTRGQFSLAVLWDIACSIYENYLALCSVTPHDESYIWACGGGLESQMLRQFLADLSGKEIRVRNNYRQATVAGGAVICNRIFGLSAEMNKEFTSIKPLPGNLAQKWHEQWKSSRNDFKMNRP